MKQPITKFLILSAGLNLPEDGGEIARVSRYGDIVTFAYLLPESQETQEYKRTLKHLADVVKSIHEAMYE